MGYRVGHQCLDTSEQAHDYLLSQLLPTVTTDGQLLRPVKNGQIWELSGQQIQLSFPECSVSSQIEDGVITAAPLIGLATIIFGFRAAKRLIENMGKFEGENDG